MGHNHDHSHIKTSKEKPLLWALILTSTFLIAEAVGGLLSGSLALLSDAAHMLTDVTALAIALLAIKIAQRPADDQRTFGYYRFEILAATFNAILLFLVAFYITFEAYQRIENPTEVSTYTMLLISCLGLIVNLISMRLLTAGKDHSLNMKSAYLEVWSDMLGSVGVIIAAIIIKITHWYWVDSVVAILIGLWVLPRTWMLLKESINILLEGVPKGIDIKKLEEALRNIEGVQDIHELHVWAINSNMISLTSHIVVDSEYNHEAVLRTAKDLLAHQFGILHTTLQYETEKCHDTDEICTLNSH